MSSETKKVRFKDKDGYELKNVFYFERKVVDGVVELRNEYCSLRQEVKLNKHFPGNKVNIWTIFDKNGNRLETIADFKYAKQRMFELSKRENPKLRIGRLSYARNNIHAYL